MKVLDWKRARILGINALDLLVLVCLVLLAVLLLSRFFTSKQETRRFSGLNIQNAVLECDRLTNSGFVVNAKIEGRWTLNGTDFEGEALIYWASQTRLFGWVDGRRLTIGGTNAYLEDIAARSIEISTTSPSVIHVVLTKTVEAKSAADIVEYLGDIAKNVSGEFGVETLRIQARSLVFDMPGFKSNAVAYSMLGKEFHERIPYKIYGVHVYDDFISLVFDPVAYSIRDVDLLEVGDIFKESGLNHTQLFANQVELYVGTYEDLGGITYRSILDNAREMSDILDLTKLTYVP